MIKSGQKIESLFIFAYNNGMDISKQILEFLPDKVDKTKLTGDTVLEEIGLDSIDLVEITLEIENFYHIDFTSSEISKLVTVNDLVRLVERKTK